MEMLCHRCRSVLKESEPFCPQCGAPQLRYEAPEEPAQSSTSGPVQRLSVRFLNSISARDAILAAAMLAVPAGVLSALLGFEALWVLLGGWVVISIYRRRTGTMPTSRMGWRIGMLLGFFAAVIAAAFNGIALLVQRYAFHQGAALDQHFRSAIEMSTKMYSGLFATSNPEMASAVSDALRFWLTPNGIAAMVLSNALLMGISMLLFAGAGGALAARFTAKVPQHTAR